MAKKLQKISPLRKYRTENGLSVDKLAAKLELAESTIRSLENGNRECTAEMAVTIEKKLGIPRSSMRPDLWPVESEAA